ncbi:DUF2207 domain-containing protein [Gracilibacillus salinarum]|uniref:DUF2207 domain-containing protein n=1 Tax=Gracilibacillus salinarum TaxID=2932255 RepID=A0ABY4GUW5_9BACI|nr:DUF2207 domain-containing protein [Gracilibacillus salinarum]UOQ87452.1 DUF2207 domain-containing protein [Gracilibacillus salinarum]
MVLLLTILVSMFALPQHVFAVDYSIENTEINAYLQENGDVQVTEQHTYQFDDEFNGITRALIPKEQTQIIDFQASENNTALTVEQEENLYKIYRSGSDQKISIDLSYTITNGVEVYTDLAQFYWPFFDNSNESAYLNMDIYIHPPQSTGDALALGYDEAYETSTIAPDGVVHFAMGEVPSGRNGDIRVAYDASLFAASTMFDGTIREEMEADQIRLAEEAAAYENRKEMLSRISPYLISGVTIYLLLLFITVWRRKQSRLLEAERSISSLLSLPNSNMSLPATILYMRNMSPKSDLLVAALLDLVRKGYVKRDGDRTFVSVDSKQDYQHESILINWLFHKIGDHGVFSLSALDTYVQDKHNHSDYHSDYQKWVQAVKKELKKHALIDKQIGLRWMTAIVGLFLIPFSIILGVHSIFTPMVFSIMLSLIFILFAMIYQPKTVEGVRIKQQWEQLHSNYSNISEQEWNDWMSDQQMQAYIYAIGTGHKAMQKKSEHLSKSFTGPATTDTTSQTNDIVMLVLIASTMTQEFDKAGTIVSATTSSGNAGGGAGVGGGGGGSGAF